MGTSTDAILFWGIVFDEDKPEIADVFKDDDKDFEEIYAAKKGWKEDSGYFTPAGEYAHLNDPKKHDEARKVWRKHLAELEKINSACPAEIGTHCSGEYPMYYVCIKETEKTAHRGYAVDLYSDSLHEKQIWLEQLKEYCEVMGISLKGKRIGWHLVSYWG